MAPTEKVALEQQGFFFPMPMTLVGSDLTSGPSFSAVAWANRCQMKPPRVMVSVGKSHATADGVHEHGQFSICFPSVDQVAVTDWCGLTSAKRGVDKGAPFTIFRGSLEHAPMISECPLCLECTVQDTTDLGGSEIFVAEIIGTWTEARFLTPDGKPDIAKLRPFVLTMPDNRYWTIGEPVADAWSVGRGFAAGVDR